MDRVGAWPEELHRQRQGFDRERAKDERRRDEVLDAISVLRMDTLALAATTTWLEAKRESSERLPGRDALESAMSEVLLAAGLSPEALGVLEREDLYGTEEEGISTAALLAVASVELLRKRPDEASWAILTSLRHRGRRLECAIDQSLAQALMDDEGLRERLIELARRMVDRACNAPLDQVSSSDRDMFSAMVEDWRDKPELLELWFGLRGLSYIRYHGAETSILGEIARFDVPAFVSLLSRFDNPYPVQAALEATDASITFETWREIVEAAPEAFVRDGTWIGSMILPVLLVIAGEALRRGGDGLWREDDAEILDAAGRDLLQAVTDAVRAVLSRTDGQGALLRWCAWSTRALASRGGYGPAIPKDIRDPGFAALQLLSASGDAVGPDGWDGVVSCDLKPEEAWFSLMARIMAVPQSISHLERHAHLLAEFIDWWPQDDRYETWRGEQGSRLRGAASVVGSLATTPGTIGTRILAVPLAMNEDPAGAWKDLWRRCGPLREDVEFDRRDSSDDSVVEVSRAAADLLRIAIDVGLCALDQIADERLDLSCDIDDVMGRLLADLWTASSEMMFVDRFSSDWWDQLRRHLVLRRVLYFEGGPEREHIRRASDRSAIPAASMLGDLASIDRQFVAILLELLDSGMSIDSLRLLLIEARVNPSELVAAIESANEIDNRHPVASNVQLDRLRDLAA